jgi:ribosomal protein S18 acetylase RimI-like enzyme
MEFALLGWPESGPTLRLDYREFAYAGKFVMSNTGKAVIRDPDATDAERTTTDPSSTSSVTGDSTPKPPDPDTFDESVLAAVAFNEDRTDPGVCWLRYITVARAHRGEGLGPQLAEFVAGRAEDRGYRRLRIAVNNPFAYEAMYKAGFVYTGRQTGVAELVLERPGQRDRATYQCGLDEYRQRDLENPEADFLADHEGSEPPTLIDAPATPHVTRE